MNNFDKLKLAGIGIIPYETAINEIFADYSVRISNAIMPLTVAEAPKRKLHAMP